MLRKWILKAIVQKSISVLPYKNKINYFFQKYVTKGVELTELHFSNKITAARDHITFLQKHKNVDKLTCLELGTGWYPVVPISLYLCGCQQIFTIDISAHLTKTTLLKTIELFFEWEAAGKLAAYLPHKNEEKWLILQSVYERQSSSTLNEILANLNIQTIVGDARDIDLAEKSIDFICSNNTFEHIYPTILKAILSEFKRLIKADGLMSHFIDMSDHFAHFDKSISIYNFLQFTETQWKWIDNSIQPQNRMRLHQYQEIYKALNIPYDIGLVKQGDLKALSNIELKPPFSAFTKHELAISHGYLLSKITTL